MRAGGSATCTHPGTSEAQIRGKSQVGRPPQTPADPNFSAPPLILAKTAFCLTMDLCPAQPNPPGTRCMNTCTWNGLQRHLPQGGRLPGRPKVHPTPRCGERSYGVHTHTKRGRTGRLKSLSPAGDTRPQSWLDRKPATGRQQKSTVSGSWGPPTAAACPPHAG